MRPLAQSAFVDEDDRAAFPAGFFLMAGQVFFFQMVSLYYAGVNREWECSSREAGFSWEISTLVL
jgi:hypothetical protein